MKIGNTTFSDDAKNMSFEEFKDKYQGKIDFCIHLAYNILTSDKNGDIRTDAIESPEINAKSVNGGTKSRKRSKKPNN